MIDDRIEQAEEVIRQVKAIRKATSEVIGAKREFQDGSKGYDQLTRISDELGRMSYALAKSIKIETVLA